MVLGDRFGFENRVLKQTSHFLMKNNTFWVSRAGQDGFKTGQHRLMRAQETTKTALDHAETAPRVAQDRPWPPQEAQDRSKLIPTYGEERPKSLKIGPSWYQDGFKRSKMAPRCFEKVSRWFQELA